MIITMFLVRFFFKPTVLHQSAFSCIMVRNFLLHFFLFIFLSSNLIAQKVHVYNNDKEPIPYANILYLNSKNLIVGDYCNEIGEFILPTIISFDEIELSCVGFEKLTIKKELIKDTIFLKEEFVQLNEVVITNKVKSSFIVAGYCEEKQKVSIGFSKGMEVSMFLENIDRKEKKIKSFLFKVNKKENNKSAVRIHFYKKSITNLQPGDEIFKENIVRIIEGKTKAMIEVDISDYNLIFPEEGAFIGIEFLGYIDSSSGVFFDSKYGRNDTQIAYNDKTKQPITFIRDSFNNKKWNDTNLLKKDFEGYVNFINTPNACFGLKLYTN